MHNILLLSINYLGEIFIFYIIAYNLKVFNPQSYLQFQFVIWRV